MTHKYIFHVVGGHMSFRHVTKLKWGAFSFIIVLGFFAAFLLSGNHKGSHPIEISETGLFLSAKAHDSYAVSRILAAGISPNIVNQHGQQPINLASQEDIPHTANEADAARTVRALVGAGATVNVVERNGDTPIYMAAMWASGALLEALLQAGADPNFKNSNGDTALIEAVKWANAKAVKILMKNHADPNKKNDDGLSAIDICNSDAIFPEDREKIGVLLASGNF